MKTYQVGSPHSLFMLETSAWHGSHSTTYQLRRRSIVAPSTFVPFSVSSSSSVKSRGDLSLSGEGGMSRYGAERVRVSKLQVSGGDTC